ncbi:hypothetical protein KP509_04G017600 [Ceratopteris richardii]|uniref:PI3K/PI4K catalytic domain-containing protein n=1 Tax=Ceratopteris richardii TaxID=49495 RepID=A0A8T2UUY3_CERRI|nr:hypothetical protein KP509_04G017600 [Ceratopteris richardii]
MSSLQVTTMNARPTVPLPGAPADRFLGWALPLLSNASSNGDTAEIALISLKDFLISADLAATEGYIPSVLRSCQKLLEDEGTPSRLLQPLLATLTVLASRFYHIFLLHFADLVDLLLGWALMPDLSENDRCLIIDTFLHFQNYWAGNLPFSSNLLFKFLADMEVLAHDAIPGTSNEPRRLWALVSCFVAVLRAATSGILQLGYAEDAIDSFQVLLPRLLACLGMVGQKFRSFKWLKEAAACLSLFANLFQDKFSKFSGLAADFILSCLDFKEHPELTQTLSLTIKGKSGFPIISSSQLQEILKVNLEAIAIQGHTLPPNVASKLLKSQSSFSCLRLHPSPLVTGVVSQTYAVLLGHESDHVAHVAMNCLFDELIALKNHFSMFWKKNRKSLKNECQTTVEPWEWSPSETETRELIKYDLLLMASAIFSSTDVGGSRLEMATAGRANNMRNFLVEHMDPFKAPLQYCADVQLALVQSLHRLCNLCCNQVPVTADIPIHRDMYVENVCAGPSCIENSTSYCMKTIEKALDVSASFPVKLEALDWLISISNQVLLMDMDCSCHQSPCVTDRKTTDLKGIQISHNIMFALLIAASDRESKVREKVAVVLKMLLQANCIDSCCLADVVEVGLEHLGDSELAGQRAFSQLLALCAPIALWTNGRIASMSSHGRLPFGSTHKQWKEVFAWRRCSKFLRPQQIVAVLTFIAQQWQALPSSWLQRLIQNLPRDNDGKYDAVKEGLFFFQDWAPANSGQSERVRVSLSADFDFLERTCANNNLACAWWAIQEAAWHCVVVRLRTHLGGPTQTFGVLERMLLDVVQSLQADNTQREAGTGAPSIQLLPMRLLLEFVDALKKNIHNASEGSLILPNPSPASIQFFHANKKVCEEWFSRICEALMNASLAIQCHAATYHHAMLRLYDLRSGGASAIRELQRPQIIDSTLKSKANQNVLKTLRVASLALCRAHEPSMISGLQIWASSSFGSLLLGDMLPVQNVVESFGWMDGMTLQAQGQYERAAVTFTKMLRSDDALNALGADGVQFLIARTIECYVALADWEALESWLQELHTLRAQHAGKAYAGALTAAGLDMNSIHALACFDTGDIQGAWAHLDLTPQTSGDLTPDPHQALQRSEQMLLQAMLRSEGGTETDVCLKEAEKARLMLDEALLVSGFDGLKQVGPLLMQLHCIKAFEVKCHTANVIKDNSLCCSGFLNALEHIGLPVDANIQDCLPWIKLLRTYRAVIPDHKVTTQLHWQVLRIARKHNNFELCQRLLKQSSMQFDTDGDRFLLDYERILVQSSEESIDSVMPALWDKIKNCMFGSQGLTTHDKSLRAKACLKFAVWLKQKPSMLNSLLTAKKVDAVEDGANQSPSMAFDDGLQWDTMSPYLHEHLIGATIKSAVLLCPKMGKAWFRYGFWCLSLGKQIFPKSSALKIPSLFSKILISEFPVNNSDFSEQELKDIFDIVMNASQEITDSLLTGTPMETWSGYKIQTKGGSLEAFVQHLVSLMSAAAAALQSDGASPAGILSFQLNQEILSFFPGLTSTQAAICVDKLMGLWWTLRKRRACLFDNALQGFLRYLSLSTCGDDIHEGKSKRKNLYRHDLSLASSLYVLYLLHNYGVELNDTFNQVISSISLQPWQEITAQLFARLSNHPESEVRKQLENLLMNLALSSPWAIVYSVLMSLSTSDGEPAAEVQRLLGCLMKIHPKLVKDVQLLTSELGSITVLWEEQWLSTLQDLHADITRHISSLKDAAARLVQDSTLSSSEKLRITGSNYFAVMSPVIQTLERTMAVTSRTPETPHEVRFQEQYNSQLRAAILALKSPPSNISSVSDIWHPFDPIVASLASHVKKATIPLAEISPRLAMLSSSNVPIPGLEKQVAANDEGNSSQKPQIISLIAFEEQVQILATKTKPKKLTMIGSDGKTYTYLLKGHEDLRLDARIMQLLHAVNGMLCHHNVTRGKTLAARHYSVTPISGQAGLIQWVDNLVSMYTVFKAWQQRHHSSTASPHVPPAVPRPSDMFYGKLLPALKDRGLRKVSSRREWPQEVKRKVLLELMKETPRQLLYKELWCASDGFNSFNEKLQRFRKLQAKRQDHKKMQYLAELLNHLLAGTIWRILQMFAATLASLLMSISFLNL